MPGSGLGCTALEDANGFVFGHLAANGRSILQFILLKVCSGTMVWIQLLMFMRN